ncbi:hypothetical protein [Stutzerimonas frequens]|uniref:hypothetical protein n=1 Tax=Stutzerimonas frequens TaxID=2968969 RepID=UPI00210A249F|nr:hypothetical protein [Stutzerimonas frequens]
MAKIDDVDQQHCTKRQCQIEPRYPAKDAGAGQVPDRQPRQQRDRQHQQDRQAKVEAQADPERFGYGIDRAERAGLQPGETDEENPAQCCERNEQNPDCTEPVMQAPRLKPTHCPNLESIESSNSAAGPSQVDWSNFRHAGIGLRTSALQA